MVRNGRRSCAGSAWISPSSSILVASIRVRTCRRSCVRSTTYRRSYVSVTCWPSPVPRRGEGQRATRACSHRSGHWRTTLGLGGRVRFLGRVTEEEKRALYSAATLFVFPSLYEGFGLDPLEAMACGAPVLASNRSSLPEVVGGGAALVDPTEHAAFTRALAVLLDSPRRRAELSKRGSSVAATFSWERTAKMTLEVYRQARARDR